MNKNLVCILIIFSLLAGSISVFADTATKKTTTKKTTEKVVIYDVTGSISSIDSATNDVVVKNDKGETKISFTKELLGTLKVGDVVKVSYKKTADGKLVATKAELSK